MAGNLIYRNCCFCFKKVSRLNFSYRREVHASFLESTEKDNDLITMMELRKQFRKMRGVKPGVYVGPKEDRTYLLQYLPKTQEELPPRRLKDTVKRAVLPLTTYLELQERYVHTDGRLRFGRLMEDLDMFSDWVAMHYIKNPKQPAGEISSYAMVTVKVDDITFTGYVPVTGMDIRISGYVSGVGKTTIETTVWMEQNVHGEYKMITTAIFLMAARNATLSGGAIVNPLVGEEEEEKRIMTEAKERTKERLAQVKVPFLAQLPNEEEQGTLHKLFVESIDTQVTRRALPATCQWMAETKRNNNVFSFTEDRNFHDTVFGGFLMRNAVETAWFTAYFYCRHRPTLRTISDIHFKRPVALGSIIEYYGQVVYTEGKMMEVFVHGDVNDPFLAGVKTSVMFYFTYESPEPIPCVMPDSYYEAMMFVQGRRQFRAVAKRNNIQV